MFEATSPDTGLQMTREHVSDKQQEPRPCIQDWHAVAKQFKHPRCAASACMGSTEQTVTHGESGNGAKLVMKSGTPCKTAHMGSVRWPMQ